MQNQKPRCLFIEEHSTKVFHIHKIESEFNISWDNVKGFYFDCNMLCIEMQNGDVFKYNGHSCTSSSSVLYVDEKLNIIDTKPPYAPF